MPQTKLPIAPAEKAKVFRNGRSQAVRIPARYRFNTDEVYIRQDKQTGDLILSKSPRSLPELFTAFDALGLPSDFMEDRDQGVQETRDEL